MPLYTNDIEQARIAYAALEQRAQGAEDRMQQLQAVVDDLKKRIPITVEEAASLRQNILNRDTQIITLQDQLQQAAQPVTGISLQNFVGLLGLAVAIGEASMPDRAIPSVGATVQAHMTLQDGTVGLRLYQPESSSSVGLGTTSFEIDKIPPQPGVPPPRPFYVVLEDKQKLYTNDFWLKFEAATQIVAEIGKTITNTGAWNFAFLVQAAIRIADLEKKLSGLIAASVPADRAKAYSVAADGLAAQAQALSAKTNPVAGDLFLLSATLDTATTIGKSFPS